MTDTDRMVAWLREALDAAWHDAETAANDLWWADHAERIEVYNAEGVLIAGADDAVRGLLDANNPAAVLRRIAADRKQLAEHPVHVYEAFGPRCKTCRGGMVQMHSGPIEAGQPYPCTTVRLLAEGWGWTEETT